jgi:hypothetical protein
MNVIREIGNTLSDFIELTSDSPSQNQGGWMPILDLQCKVDESGLIIHKYYEKPMNTKFCMLSQSAVSTRTKFTTLVQDRVRRLQNYNERESAGDRRQIFQDYLLKMRRRGYNGKFRKRVIKAALGIHRDKVKRDSRGGRPLYRSKSYQMEQRRLKKETSRKNWYCRDKGGDKFYLAPLIMNPTPRGLMRDKIRKICEEVGDKCGISIKNEERGGDKLKRL